MQYLCLASNLSLPLHFFLSLGRKKHACVARIKRPCTIHISLSLPDSTPSASNDSADNCSHDEGNPNHNEGIMLPYMAVRLKFQHGGLGMRLTPSSTPIDLFNFTKISEGEVCIATRNFRKMQLHCIYSYLTSSVSLYAACHRNLILKSDGVQGLGQEEECLRMLLQ